METRIIALNKLGLNVINSLPISVVKNFDLVHIQDEKKEFINNTSENNSKVSKILTNQNDIDQISYILESKDLDIFLCEIENSNDYKFANEILGSIKKNNEVILLIKKNNFLSHNQIKQISTQATTTMFINENSLTAYEIGRFMFENSKKTLINNFVNSIVSINKIIYETGDINIDFADLMSVIKYSNISWFGNTISGGINKSRDAVNKLFDLHFFEGEFYGVNSMIVQIVSGEEIKMNEVTDLSNRLKSFANSKCNIFFGIKRKKIMYDQIELIVLASSKNDFPIDNSIEYLQLNNTKEEELIKLEEVHLPPFMRKKNIVTKIN